MTIKLQTKYYLVIHWKSIQHVILYYHPLFHLCANKENEFKSFQLHLCMKLDTTYLSDHNNLAKICRLLHYSQYSSQNKERLQIHSPFFIICRCFGGHNVYIHNQKSTINQYHISTLIEGCWFNVESTSWYNIDLVSAILHWFNIEF